jgi:hypothetical protein
VAGGEVVAVVVAVLTDQAIPAVVIVGIAALSLVLRRRGPSTLGFSRVARPWRLVGEMAAFAVCWSFVNVALLIPLTNHLSGTRQDVSAFADLEGDVRLLALYLSASWVLAAFCEEVAFRGYLLTRLTDVLGAGRLQQVAAVLGAGRCGRRSWRTASTTRSGSPGSSSSAPSTACGERQVVLAAAATWLLPEDTGRHWWSRTYEADR